VCRLEGTRSTLADGKAHSIVIVEREGNRGDPGDFTTGPVETKELSILRKKLINPVGVFGMLDQT